MSETHRKPAGKAYELGGYVWRTLPSSVRWLIVRLTQRKFTASAGAVVTDPEGRVLLLEHIFRPASGWGIPGGFIEPGEDPAAAVRREVFEETGVEIRDVSFHCVRNRGTHLEFVYSASAGGGGGIKCDEIVSMGWFSPESLPEEMHPAQKSVVLAAIARRV
jgi:ADP-ribose pyrophosphatase YjhB (NUDIX family)